MTNLINLLNSNESVKSIEIVMSEFESLNLDSKFANLKEHEDTRFFDEMLTSLEDSDSDALDEFMTENRMD